MDVSGHRGGPLSSKPKTQQPGQSEGREGETRLQRALEIETVGVAFFKTSGEITHANNAFLRMSGYSREDVAKGLVRWDTMTPSEFMPRSLAALEEFRTKGRTAPYEKQYVRKNGTRWWGLFSSTRVGEEEGVKFVIDITETKRAEEIIRFQASLLDAVDQAVIASDMQGRVTYWNRYAEKLFGWRGDEVLGKPVQEVTPADVSQGQAQAILATLLRGESWSGEILLRRKDASVFPALVTDSPIYDPQGQQVGVVGVSFDLSERKDMEEKLREGEEQMRLVLSASRTGIWIFDVIRQHIYWSPEHYEIFGTQDFDGSISSFHRFIHPEDLADTWAKFVRALEGGGHYRAEFRIIRPDGETRWVGNLGHAEYSTDGRPRRFLGTVFDITERKRAEEALREADRRKDEFLATLAHELRNPLAPIRMSLEIMKRTNDFGEDQEAKAVIERQLNHIVRLVDDLLDISRISRGTVHLHKEHVELSEIIKLALESSRPFIEERGHDLQVSLPFKKIMLEADTTRLVQVLLNLLNNAAKYTEPGGKIVLSAEQAGSEIVVRVKDTGLGIPPENITQLFELFVRLERDVGKEGLGIGLSLVKRLVEMHGGSAQAYSAGLGQGSEFTVRLPVLVDTTNASPRAPVKKALSATSRRLLVVDDYEPNRKTLLRLLKLMGHEATSAESGERALELLPLFKPEVVFLDINMPGMTGYDVARSIRKEPSYQGITLVALTGYGQEEDVQRARAAGFDVHLVKPVEIERLETLLTSGSTL